METKFLLVNENYNFFKLKKKMPLFSFKIEKIIINVYKKKK